MANFTATVSPFVAPDYDLFSPARRSDPRGLVQGAPLDGAQSYVPWIGLSTVRELALQYADKVGLVERERLEEAELEISRWQLDAEHAEARVAVLEATQERIAGLSRDGYTVVKKQGRPTKESK